MPYHAIAKIKTEPLSLGANYVGIHQKILAKNHWMWISRISFNWNYNYWNNHIIRWRTARIKRI